MSKNYNIGAEQIVLGAALSNELNFNKIINLTEKDFFEPLHKEIYRKMGEFYMNGTEINPVMLTPYFAEHKTISELQTTAGNYMLTLSSKGGNLLNLNDYVEHLKKLNRVREFEDYIRRHNLVDINTDIDASLVELEEIMFEPSRKTKLRKQSQVGIDIAKDLEKKLPCYSTGYSILDKALGGGLYRSKSYCLIGRQKTGKTAALGSISHNLSKAGVKHLYIAIEMGADEIHKRIMAYQIGYNPITFYDKEKREEDHFKTQIFKLANQDKGSTIYADAPGINFDDLKRLILSSVKKYKLEGVIIDYLQIITGEKKGENKAEFYGRIAQWIADIGRDADIFTLSGAQANDDGNARGSMGIQAAMDLNLFMLRPDDQANKKRWFEVSDSRYTIAMRYGSQDKPTFELGGPGKGVFLMQLDDFAVYDTPELNLQLNEPEQDVRELF